LVVLCPVFLSFFSATRVYNEFPKSLAVYCDDLVRDLVARCDSICGKNASMEPIRKNLVSVQVRRGREVLTDFNLFEKDNETEDDEYWAYTL
jgi:hypothetical protein